MKDKKYKVLFFIIVFIVILYNCSPAPMLQSPRVKSNVAFGVSGMRDKYNGNKEEKIWEIHPLNLKLGFFDRVDVSGVFIPYSHNVKGANIKIFIKEHGHPTLFKNLSYALISGLKSYGTDLKSEGTSYIGTIFATRHIVNQQEFELILQPSYYKIQYEWNGALTGGGQPNSKADGFQINFGTIYSPYNSPKMNLELIMGGMYRYIKNSNSNYSYLPEGKDLSLYNKWVIQAGIIFNFKIMLNKEGK